METKVEMRKNIIQDIASYAPAISDNAAKAAFPAFIALGCALYIHAGKLSKYSIYDQTRHAKLVSQYRRLCRTCNPASTDNPDIIPEGWKLDADSRPLRDFDLKTVGSKLAFEFEDHEIQPIRIHSSASAMLSTIIKLFDSLSNRTRGKLPAGSIEGMFFSELANWIVIELPLLQFDTKESLEILEARKEYCHEVLTQVLDPDNRRGRNNPVGALREIMISLNAIIEATEDLIQLTTFHEHGARLDDAILGMATQTFQVFQLMIKGDKTNERDLQVHLFLDDTQTYRPKISALKQKRLGLWLKETLMKVDIRNNDFIAHRSISLAEAANHLYGEYIDDTPCTLPPKLRKNPNHPDWGHWDFTLTNLNGSLRDISDTTKNIRQIYRDILKLYYIRDLLVKLRKVSPVYGEVWLYKDTTGKAMLSMLLNMVEEITTKLNKSVDSFFNTTIDLFDAKITEAQITKDDECHHAIGAARLKYRLFTKNSTKATEQIKIIRQRVETFDPRLAQADETKYLLLKAIVEFIESNFGEPRTGSVYSQGYEILKRALNETLLSSTPSGATSSSASSGATSSSASSGATSSSASSGATSSSASSGATSSSASSGATSSSTPSGATSSARATSYTTRIEAHYKTLRELRIRATQVSDITKLDLSACGLSTLSKKDRKKLCQQLKSLPNHRIIEADLKDNALYNITKDSEEDKEIATATLTQIVLNLPVSITTLYLAGNGIQYYNHAELSKLFSGFPKHILTVSLRGEEPLELSQQLARLEWPKSYYDIAYGKHNFMAIAKELLVDYSKSCGFEVFLSLHWNRHLTAQIREIWTKIKTKELDTGEKLFKELDIIDKGNNYHGGSFSRRYTFLYHCYSGRTPSLESSRSHSPAAQVADAEDTHSTIELSSM